MTTPKKFLIRCPNCRWCETTTGISKELQHLHEYKNSCPSCGKARKFRCPKCGQQAVMKLMKNNV